MHKPADRPDPETPGLRAELPRRSARTAVNAQVILRRSGQPNYRVRIYDVSPGGCKIEFVERPSLDDRVWIKFDGLEALEALVCWVDGFVAGVALARPIHPAVFEQLVRKLG